MNPSQKAKLLNRVVEIHDTLQDLAHTHDGELNYECRCFDDAVAALSLAIKRLRGQSTIQEIGGRS